MLKKRVSLVTTRLFALIGPLLLITALSMTACTFMPYHRGCEACPPPAGSVPDAISPTDTDGVLSVIINKTLYAFQDHSGKQLWHYTITTPNYSQPVVNVGTVYLLTANANNYQSEEWVYALSSSTGQVLWHTHIATLPTTPSLATLQVVQGIVYAPQSIAPYGSSLFALRTSDGKILWQENPYGLNGQSPTLLLATPAIAYLSSYDAQAGYVVARRVSDGAQLWQHALPGCFVASAPLVNTVLYMSTICSNGWGETDAFQAETGKLLWRFSPGGSVIATTSTVYLDDTDNSNPGTDRFFAVDANTGQLLWKRVIPVGVISNTRIWAANEQMVYTTINGTWFALGARDGKTRWQFSSGTYSPQPDASTLFYIQAWFYSNNFIYFPLYNQFDAFQALTGKLLWHFSPPAAEVLDAIQSYTVPLSRHVLYLSTSFQQQSATPQSLQTHAIYAIQADTGKIRWHTIQPQSPKLVTPDMLYVTFATGKPYHYTYHLVALRSSSGKPMWTFQA